VDLDIDFTQDHVADAQEVVYSSGKFVSTNETVTACQVGDNPHHHHIRGKPHPNGLLVIQPCFSILIITVPNCCNENGVLLGSKIRRRITQDIEPLENWS